MFDCCKLINVEGRLCSIDAGSDEMNRGGLIELFVICQDMILSVPSYSFSFDINQRSELDGMMRLRQNAEAYRFRFTPETGVFTEVQQEDDSGIYYDQTLTIQVPKDRPEITWLKYQMRNKRYAFIYRDQNGIAKYLPSLRVKMDLDTKSAPSEYNGHTLNARRASKKPALHWKLTPGQTLEDIFLASILQFRHEVISFPSGIQENGVAQISFLPFSDEAIVLILNNSIKLEPGTHYVISENRIFFKFSDEGTTESPSTIQAFYAYEDQGTAIGSYVTHIETKSVAYTSGETFSLPSAPIDIQHLYITYNDTLLLQPGVHFTLSGSTVTLLFDSEPSLTDTDTFNCTYLSDSGSLSLGGFRNYVLKTKLEIPIGETFTLPHTPISGSLMAWYDNTIRLREGVHYNITNDEVEILFNIPATSGTYPTILDFWYAY
jgi:hypothetical protein